MPCLTRWRKASGDDDCGDSEGGGHDSDDVEGSGGECDVDSLDAPTLRLGASGPEDGCEDGDVPVAGCAEGREELTVAPVECD